MSTDGKPPKSPEQIRATLKAIHDSSEATYLAGPHAGGLRRDYPITIATFFDRRTAQSLQTFLSQSGIFSQVVNVWNGATVVVDNEDHEKAAELYTQYRNDFPNLLPKQESRRFDYLIFGFAIGLTLGVIVVADVWSKPKALSIPITFAGIGIVTGHLLDRLRMSNVRTGRYRIGVWELLMATAIPGMLILAIRFVRDIFSG